MALKYKKLLKSAIIIGGLTFSLVVVALLLKSEWIAENIFARGVSRWYITAVGYINSVFPFSIFEVFCALAVIAIIVAIVFTIKFLIKRHYASALNIAAKVVIGVLSVVFLYMVTATPAYYRSEIYSHLPYNTEKLTDQQVLNLAEYCLTDYNNLSAKMPRNSDGVLVAPYSNSELASKIIQEYDKLTDSYFNSYSVAIKPIGASGIMSLLGIIGVSFQPTGEANYNYKAATLDMPCLMAHELSHSKGVMREGDAELISAYITLTSSDDFIRYSGYSNFFGYIINTVNQQISAESYKGFKDRRSDLVKRDMAATYKHYEKYDTFIAEIGSFFNDIYLKMHGATNGVGSYVDGGTVTIVPKPDGTEEKIIVYSPIYKMLSQVLAKEAQNGKNI